LSKISKKKNINIIKVCRMMLCLSYVVISCVVLSCTYILVYQTQINIHSLRKKLYCMFEVDN